jgi:glycosyltransferase involved in cell wall biosynthesis
LLFDVTGLIQWYCYFWQPSGVQRVTERLFSSAPIREFQMVEFVGRALGSDHFFRVEPQILLSLGDPDWRNRAVGQLRAVFAASMRFANPGRLASEARYYHLPYVGFGLVHLERLIQAWYGELPHGSTLSLDLISPPTASDTLFNPGDFWCHSDYVATLVKLKQANGVRIVQLIHDLFAIDRPDWTHPGFGHVIRRQLAHLAPHVDLWLTNSSFVTGQVHHYLKGLSLPRKPIEALPMGWETADMRSSPEHRADEATLRRYGVREGGFILHVGTVEPRKNLMALLDAVAQVRRELGSQMPDCVLVGRDGWRSKQIHERLRQTRNEGGTLLWIKNVADRDLAAFYRKARFTVVPSHAEGWGLPVTESLAHGVPCIAADVGGLREAGQNLAAYFDPDDPDGLKKAVRDWVADDQVLEQARAYLVQALEERRLPTWQDAGAALLRAVKA